MVPPITNEFQLRENEANRFHRSKLSVREWHELFQSAGWSVECYRHDFRPGLQHLNFAALSASRFSPSDFTFLPCTLEEMHTEPTLSAVFALSKTPSNHSLQWTPTRGCAAPGRH